MVSFLITGPTGQLLNNGRQSRGVPIGKLGKKVLYLNDRRQASDEWALLSRTIDLNLSRAQRRYIPVTAALGQSIYSEIHEHPDMFFLLIKEAEQRGINIPLDVVGSYITNQLSGQLNATDPLAQEAVRHFLMVKMLRDQLASNVKFTEPMWKHDLSSIGNRVTLFSVDFSAGQFLTSASQPTTQQVQALYDDFRHVNGDSGRSSPERSAGVWL